MSSPSEPNNPTSPNGPVDRAGDVRRGEELDIAAVDTWLKARRPELSGQPSVTQYSGGASNWTYRLAYDNADLILRRPPTGTKAAGAHDMGREFRIQRALADQFPFVPEMIAHCDDESVIGCEFYVMRRLVGIIPRNRMPRGVDLSPEQARQLCMHLIDRLIDLHQVDVAASGLDNLGKGAAGDGYVRRQIDGWTARYTKAKTWNVPSFKRVMAYLDANAPADVDTRVVHNDFRLDNVVLDADDPTRVLGILDWELATLGDPLMDLGNTLSYWVQADDDRFIRAMSRQPTFLPGMFTRDEVVDYYLQRTGYVVDDFTFYEVYGLFRVAVIVQQIYYRYHHGQTDNPAYRHFWLLAHYLNWRCRRLIKRSSRAARQR